jgi:hypothetical protein
MFILQVDRYPFSFHSFIAPPPLFLLQKKEKLRSTHYVLHNILKYEANPTAWPE